MPFAMVQILSEQTKKEIARRVSSKIYEELKNNNYLESAYIFNVANEIATRALNIQLIPAHDFDGFTIRATVE